MHYVSAMIDITQPAVQAALVGTGITVINLLVLTVIGWFVTRHIAKLGRDSTEAIAKLTRDLTEQQIEIARAQVDVNRQTQVMNLLKDRTAIKEEVLAAIDARSNEITFKSDPHDVKEPEALYALWKVEQKLKVLFEDDVQAVMQKIHEQLKRRHDVLMIIRRAEQKGNIKLNEEAADAYKQVIEFRDELVVTMNRYSSMGHIRMLD